MSKLIRTANQFTGYNMKGSIGMKKVNAKNIYTLHLLARERLR